MRVVVLNAGSATVKGALIEVEGPERRALWRGTRPLGSDGRASPAFAALLEELGPLRAEVQAVGHRVVHGGARFTQPLRIDAAVEAAIDDLSTRAPLHNPRALEGVRVARAHFPETPMVAVFDTAFHAERSPESLRYALPWKRCEELQLFRSGFHGIAHAALVEALAHAEASTPERSSAVTLQLGAGCSACAVVNGRSIETSMGFSPLGGLPMATRSGDLDPGVLLALLRSGCDPAELEHLVTHESGFLGMAGSSDLRDLLFEEARGEERARVAIALFVRRVVSLVGAYLTLTEGRGAIVFGGGIGTHSAEIRRRVCVGLATWNVELDPERNGSGELGRLTPESSRAVYAFETDEESHIARSTAEVLETSAAGAERAGPPR